MEVELYTKRTEEGVIEEVLRRCTVMGVGTDVYDARMSYRRLHGTKRET